PSSVFGISSIDAIRNAQGDLVITIHTNFAGVPGTAAADGTNYGSLFFGSASSWSSTVTGPAPYSTDIYHPNQWTSAFVMSGNASGGTGSLYSTGTNATPNGSPQNGTIPNSYTTTTGQITMSNAFNDPVSYPNSGNNGFYFRQGQAVLFTPNSGQTAIG